MSPAVGRPARDGSKDPPTVAVVGGGIAGLAAAWELSGGAEGAAPGCPRVVVLEAGEALGGKLRSAEFAGGVVDLGPDGFLGRRPEATALCRELGMDEDLEPIGRSGAAVWAGGRRRTLPGGLMLGVPTRWWPAARSRVLGTVGSLRLALDVVAPRPDRRGPLGDRAIGPLVARKLGRRTVDRLVEPLIGGIHAGGVDDMSTAAVFPLLLAVSQRRGGLMRSLRRASSLGAGPTGALPTSDRDDEDRGPGDGGDDSQGSPAGQGSGEGPGGSEEGAGGPAFWAVRGGMAHLVGRLTGVLEQRGAELRTGTPVVALERSGAKAWALRTPVGTVEADGVVLAVPAPPAAELLAPHDAEAAGLLRGIDHASVAVVTLAVAPEDLPEPLEGTGLLVPHGSALPRGTPGDEVAGRSFLVTACTYLSAKWPHLARPDTVLVRASVGRAGDQRPDLLDDAGLVERVVSELGALIGLRGTPRCSMVTRWPDALPQYRVHHLLRVTSIEAAVARLPALAVAGAAYRGVGIPACIGSGRGAARRVLGAFDDTSGAVGAGR